ncbi:GSCOCG00008528001-RA-CDS [Cotesia congregata]|uniref:Proline-rich transmembrane protein 3/4 domain-containing protein n=1 Tax=Cotesia congregata TaxID=51543 RepID=A0A8J2MJ41_COTCN|nr:GSCOCG00008528001-RA-CDS [Cotesia congregata]CAG5089082.1 Protein of unknown function [Cotesia congregata]
MKPSRRMITQLLVLFLLSTKLTFVSSEGGFNSHVYNLDLSPLDKNIAAIFNKGTNNLITTKRSLPAYDGQVSDSSRLSTAPSPLTTTGNPLLSSFRYPVPRVTIAPAFRELPSYAPPSRAPFTPPLPPEYLNPFADKPTLRGTNSESHSGVRRPIPPPSLTPAHERIPIRPPDLVQSSVQPEKLPSRNKALNTPSKEQKIHDPPHEVDRKNTSNDYLPVLHTSSISRILSGSNGRKQENIPDILLRSMSTKSPEINLPAAPTTQRSTTSSTTVKTTTGSIRAVSYPTIFNLPNTRQQEDKTTDQDSKPDQIEISGVERLPFPQPQPPAPSKVPIEDRNVPQVDTHPLESTWKIVWSLHVYVAAIMFTLMALYSIYKIFRFNEATNLLTQSYFLTVHLLLTTVCTLRCFHLFYDAYNLDRSFSEPLSQVLMYLPAPLLSTGFGTLVVYLAKCSEAPSLNNKFLSPMALALFSTVHIVLCISLQVSSHVVGYEGGMKIFPLICQCIYIVVCVTLGLCYMYVYRVVKSQINLTNNKSVGPHVSGDPAIVVLGTAITTTIATGLLFILMGFVQLYGIFGVREREPPFPWLWWGWEFSVRLLELSICGLLAWVASLSQYPLREKQLQQHSAHSGFALFPCGSSTSTENMDDALYPAICSTNQAIQNYTMRTGKQVYDDSFPLNTLPEHLNISGTFERHSIRKSGTMGHFPHERSSLNRHGNGTQTLRSSETRRQHTPVQGPVQGSLADQPPASGSTMLVAEDGFVRFRSLGAEEEDLSDSQSIVGTHGRGGSSLAGSVRYSARHTPAHQHSHQHPHQYPHQHSLQHTHSNQAHHPVHHQSHHQLYNNT